MRKFWAILMVVLGGTLVIGLPVLLYFLGGEDQSALERLRDITIVMLGILLVLVVLLLLIMVFILLWLAITVNEKIIPMLQTLVATAIDTAYRVKGTTEFVTEEVAAPIISFYSSMAKARAMAKTVTGRDKQSKRGGITRIFRR